MDSVAANVQWPEAGGSGHKRALFLVAAGAGLLTGGVFMMCVPPPPKSDGTKTWHGEGAEEHGGFRALPRKIASWSTLTPSPSTEHIPGTNPHRPNESPRKPDTEPEPEPPQATAAGPPRGTASGPPQRAAPGPPDFASHDGGGGDGGGLAVELPSPPSSARKQRRSPRQLSLAQLSADAVGPELSSPILGPSRAPPSPPNARSVSWGSAAFDRVRQTTSRELRKAFDQMSMSQSKDLFLLDQPSATGAGGSRVLSKDDFIHVCTSQLDLDLSASEVERLFDQLDEAKSGKLNFTQFRQAVNRSSFFKTIASNYNSAIEFAVAKDYDFTRSTSAQYRHPDYVVTTDRSRDGGRSGAKKWSPTSHGEVYGPLRSIRQRLDYSYHVNYSKKRQLWQDQLISNVVVRTVQQQRPWLVFTCGAMGAGKGECTSDPHYNVISRDVSERSLVIAGYALNWLSKQGLFPLEQIVHIDPDYFKRVMPEWKSYIGCNAEQSGTLCHQESGYIQEIAQEVALNNCQNVWIDGSMRDWRWYVQMLSALYTHAGDL